ncbi:MAG: plasma-membrane proton-efflux P-type ATPase [Campylobacterota bacterium]|nr:plasma-membrane proton-efflux P-type ATPase [Campylobacterota bacterium]
MSKSKIDTDEILSKHQTSIDGISSDEAEKRLSQYGLNALEEKHESRLLLLLKSFWGPIPWMVEIAAILSLVIEHWADFFIIMFMLLLNAFIEFFQQGKAQDALKALKDSMALKARVKRDGQWQNIDASKIVPGDIVEVKNGDIVPADAVTIEGKYISVDQAALTGESLPVNKELGEEIYSGSIIKQGDMLCCVTKTGEKTFFGKTAMLVQNAKNVSHFQESVLGIGKFLIIGSLIMAMFIIAKQLYVHDRPLDVIEMVLILVVASIPVAMPAVLSVTMAIGALTLSKKKAIVSRLQAIEEMAGVDVLCSDKTGTLTKNELTLGEPILFSASSVDELNLYGALASNFDGDDAIDSTIVQSVSKETLKQYRQSDFTPFDPVGKKTEAVIEHNEQKFSVVKGAPQAVIDMLDATDDVKRRASEAVEEMAKHGLRALAVATTSQNSNSYQLLGILSLFDPPRDDSKQTIDEAKKHGLEVHMVTGDDVSIAKEISSSLGLGANVVVASDIYEEQKSTREIDKIIEHSDGFARVFPEHKYNIVKSFQEAGHIVAMTGDGVNDAPALKQADVGIAVSGATDAARSAADLILTTPGLSVIIDAIEESRKIFQKIISYVKYRVAMTINIMLFVTLSILFTNDAPLSAVMIVMLALLDDIPLMSIAYDNAKAQATPVRWDMKRVLSIATVLGALSVIESFGLMRLAHDMFDTAHMQTMVFLLLVVGGHFLLFTLRHKDRLLSNPLPSKKLLLAIFSTQAVAVVIAKFGIFVPAIDFDAIAFVFVYAVVWMFILDNVKYYMERSFEKKNSKLDIINQKIN